VDGMATNLADEIKKAESDAKQIVKDAKNEAARLISEAKNEAEVRIKETRQQAFRKYRDNLQKVSDVSKEVNIPEGTIRRWMKEFNQSNKDAFPGEGNLKPIDIENRELKKRLRNLEEENAILKKAVAIFTKDEK
jgi:transposase-like protein